PPSTALTAMPVVAIAAEAASPRLNGVSQRVREGNHLGQGTFRREREADLPGRGVVEHATVALAQLAQVGRPECDARPRRARAARGERVGAERGQLDARLLGQDQVLDRLRRLTEAVRELDLDVTQLV